MTELENAMQVLIANKPTGAYYEDDTQFPGCVMLQTEDCGSSRWSIHYLDVWYHAGSDTYAGVAYSRGATECQDDDDDCEIVAVERDPRPHFRRVKK